MTELTLAQSLLQAGPRTRGLAPYCLVEVKGPDAAEFLHRLSSQDIMALAAQATVPTAFLDAKGKLIAWCLVRREAAGFALSVHAELAERLVAHLERFHFTEKLTLAAVPGACAEWVAMADAPVPQSEPPFALLRHGVRFLRWHRTLPEFAAGAQTLDAATSDALLMACELVTVGVDTDANTLALEAGLDEFCSASKGCYTGQEIVARIRTYGHVNRRVCLVTLAFGPDLRGPLVVQDAAGVPVGRLMRAVVVGGLRVGLAYLPKDFWAAGTKLQLATGEGLLVRSFG